MNKSSHYIPALGHRALTPLYDPIVRWLVRDEAFKADLVLHARLRPGQRVLDLGCGTGTLTLLIKQAEPAADVVGIDGDPQVLAIAQHKAARAGVAVQWDKGLATELPYANESFDRVLTSLVFHHLDRPAKEQALREAHRVLRPGGELHVLDFGPPQTAFGQLIEPIIRGMERMDDNLDGALGDMLAAAGFTPSGAPRTFSIVFGTRWVYQGRRATATPDPRVPTA